MSAASGSEFGLSSLALRSFNDASSALVSTCGCRRASSDWRTPSMRRAKSSKAGESTPFCAGSTISWSSRAAMCSRRRSIDIRVERDVERSMLPRRSVSDGAICSVSTCGAGLGPSCSMRSASSLIWRSKRSRGALRVAAAARRLRTSSVCRWMRSKLSGLIAAPVKASILPANAATSRSSPATTACGSRDFKLARSSVAIASSGASDSRSPS